MTLARKACSFSKCGVLRVSSIYRRSVEAAEDALVKQEFLELAAVCEEVANEIHDRRASG